MEGVLFVVITKSQPERGRIQKPRIFVQSVMCFYARENPSKITIPSQATDLIQSALPFSDFVKLLLVLMPVQVCLCVYIAIMSYPYKQLHTVEFCVCKSYVCLCYHIIPLQVTILYKLLMDSVV